MTTIHQSIRDGDLDEVARQIILGADLEARDADGRTPLMVAAADTGTSAAMIRLLLEHGADVNAVEADSEEDAASEDDDLPDEYDDCSTVLGVAVKEGSLQTVELLLEAGADAGYRRKGGYDVAIDALHGRAQAEKQDLLPLIDLLLTHGAPANGESDWSESGLSVASHIGRFDVVSRLLDAGSDPEILAWTDLMYAIALGDSEDVRRELRGGADLAARDRWQRTPLLLSLQTGNLEKAELLLQAGADLEERGNCGATALMHAVENDQAEAVSWLLEYGADLEGRDDFGNTALMQAAENGATNCVRLLLQAGALVNATDSTERSREIMRDSLESMKVDLPFMPSLEGLELPDFDEMDMPDFPGQTAIEKASSLEVVRLLVDAGAELSDISDEMRAELTGLETEGEVVCTSEEYFEAKYRRFGTANPEAMDIPFWRAMVQSGATAYAARATFDDTENYDDEAVWSFHRFGKSITELPDGRIIEVAGEHEDSYDTDFCIYNDVFVHHGGGRFEIFGYPESVFPPTDFHSATMVGNEIYIIGCLGYPELRRPGETPVYRLNCKTLRMEKVETTGDNPGWIYNHKAKLSLGPAGVGTITISGGTVYEVSDDEENFRGNTQAFALDLTTLRWSLQKEPGA